MIVAVGVAMATSVIPADAAVSRKAPTPTQVVNASFEAPHWAGVIRVPGAP